MLTHIVKVVPRVGCISILRSTVVFKKLHLKIGVFLCIYNNTDIQGTCLSLSVVPPFLRKLI